MKFYSRSFLLFLLLAIAGEYSFAQRLITGKVTDEAGRPVAYASIRIKGSSKGNWTMEDGSYKTFVPKGYDSIVCTHVNYIKTSKKIDGNTIINFVLDKQVPRQSAIAVTGTHKYTPEELSVLKNKKTEVAKDDGNYFVSVEVNAGFMGGENNFQKYLAKTIIYPDSATISDVKGIVEVGFTIDKYGFAKNVTLLKGINKFADDLVLQAITKMPKWFPAIQNGRNVEEYKEVAVSFDIKGIE